MNVSANGKMIAALTKQLEAAWAETKDHWRDTKASEFEHRFLTELVAAVDRSAPVFDDLDKILTRVRNECE